MNIIIITCFTIILSLTKFCISPKIAIIGKGPGSAICSYFLHKTIPNIKISIYNHKFIKKTLSSGIAFNSDDMYISNIIKEKNCPIINGEKWLIKDGDKFHHLNIKKLAGYNESFFLALKKYVTNELEIFKKIYNFQKNGQTFKTVRELLKSLSPDFENYYTNETVESILNKNPATCANPGIRKFVQAGLASNLTDMNAHGFTCLIFFMFSDIIAETKKIPRKNKDLFINSLFDHNDEIIGKDVWKIVRKNNKNYVVEKGGERFSYDFVILATTTADQIKYQGFKDPVKIFKYRNSYAVYMTGKLSNKIKKISFDFYPIIDIQKNQIYIQIPTYKKSNIYTIVGLDPPSESDILEYLKSYKIREKPVVFHTSPNYSTKEDESIQDAKFELGENLYNVHAMHALGIDSEMIAIGAKNIALLIKNKIEEIGTFDDERSTSEERASSSSGVGQRTNRSKYRKSRSRGK